MTYDNHCAGKTNRIRNKSGKLFFKKVLFSFLILLMGGCGSFQISTNCYAVPSALSEETARHFTMSNGLRVVIVPDKLAPVVTTQVNYFAGSAEAQMGFSGTAHALEHMMFRGSNGLDKDQLSSIGSRLGGDYNASTTEDTTRFYYTAPSEDLPILLKIEALRMHGLNLSPSEWDKERGAIDQEVSRDMSSPAYKAFSQMQALFFTGTVYEHDALGSRDSFARTNVSDLRDFYRKWYVPNNAVLVIVGDVDLDKTQKSVEDAFGRIPASDLPQHPQLHAINPKAQKLSYPSNYPVGLSVLAFPMPGASDKSFATADILADVLASQRGALYELVPKGKSLFTDFEYIPKKMGGFGLAMSAFPKGGNGQQASDEMKNILEDIRTHGVSPELVDAAKRKEIAQLEFSANSVEGLASLWSTVLTLQNLPSPDKLIAAYNNVTVESVNALAFQLLQQQHALSVELLPEESGKTQTGGAKKVAENFSSAPDKPIALPTWAEKALSEIPKPSHEEKPWSTKLSNGIDLIVRPSHITHTIQLVGAVRTTPVLEEPKGKEGVQEIAEALFSYGTTRYQRLQFQKALDDIPAWESAGTSFSLQTLTPDFEKGVALLAENELHPSFPDGDFKIVQRQLALAQAGDLLSPRYLFERVITSALVPPQDPALRQTTPQSLMSVTRDDVLAYYHKAWRPDLTTIVVAGDITPQRARDLVEYYFSEWKAQGEKPQLDLSKLPASHSSFTHVPDKSSVQNQVVLTQTVPVSNNDPQRFLLQMGNEILGGGLFSSHFYKDLRVKNGYVYSVGSAFEWGKTRSLFTIMYGCDAQKVSAARSLIERDIRQLQKTSISEEDISLAKSSLLRGMILSRDNLAYIMRHDLYLGEWGLPLDTDTQQENAYYSATSGDVQSALRKWVKVDDLAQIVRGPMP